MIFIEGPRVISPFPVWARGGQAPLRVQTLLLSGRYLDILAAGSWLGDGAIAERRYQHRGRGRLAILAQSSLVAYVRRD
jgi:hypothetical protein